MSKYDELRKQSPFTCRLCETDDETVDMWAGAPWGHAHRSCAEIAGKGITLWLKRQLWVRSDNVSYSQQRGWFCRQCEAIHPFAAGSDCPECGAEMKVLFTSMEKAILARGPGQFQIRSANRLKICPPYS